MNNTTELIKYVAIVYAIGSIAIHLPKEEVKFNFTALYNLNLFLNGNGDITVASLLIGLVNTAVHSLFIGACIVHYLFLILQVCYYLMDEVTIKKKK